MIAYVEGKLVEVQSDRIIVDCNGVGYEILVPFFVRGIYEKKLDAAGDEPPRVKVVTLYRVSQQNPKPELIGFETVDQRIFFEKLISVSGIGASKAAKALVFSVSTIAKAIESGDVATIAGLPGFGRRTADKVIAELKGKVVKEALLGDEPEGPRASPLSGIDRDAMEVLRRLGYTQQEAKATIAGVRKRLPTIESADDLVQEALRSAGLPK